MSLQQVFEELKNNKTKVLDVHTMLFSLPDVQLVNIVTSNIDFLLKNSPSYDLDIKNLILQLTAKIKYIERGKSHKKEVNNLKKLLFS